MRTIKKLLIFLLLNLLAIGTLRFLLTSPVQYPILYKECKEGQYNTLIVGHSLAEKGFHPDMLELEEGDRVFNMCIGGAPFHNIYYQIRDLHETHPLKRVYLELYWPYWTQSLYSANYIEFDQKMLAMMSAPARMEFLREERLYENYNQTFFPYKLDKTTLDTLKDAPTVARIKLDPRYRAKSPEMIMEMNDPQAVHYEGDGFFYVLQENTIEDPGYDYWIFEEEKISEDAVADFHRIADYCEAQGIELICVESALPPIRLRNENHQVSHDWFAALCAGRNLPYYDMNFVSFQKLPRTYRDYEDVDGHMIGEMAIRQATLLGEIVTAQDPDSYFEESFADVLASLDTWEAQE